MWHQKSRALGAVFTSVLRSPGVPSGRVITKLVLKHFSAIRSVRFLGKTRALQFNSDHSVEDEGLHHLFSSQVRSRFWGKGLEQEYY